jgi:hypothetical protein
MCSLLAFIWSSGSQTGPDRRTDADTGLRRRSRRLAIPLSITLHFLRAFAKIDYWSSIRSEHSSTTSIRTLVRGIAFGREYARSS